MRRRSSTARSSDDSVFGRLAQLTASGATTRFLYDGINLVAEYTGTNALLRRHVHGPGSDEPIVTYEGTTLTDRRFLMRDERGSIVSIANGSGSVTAINAYDEYGIGSTTVGSTTSAGTTGRFGYTGQMWLAELGLYHYRARIYSPTLGRFLQTDPIGYGDGMNLYAYVGNDPVNYVDPLGLFADDTELCWREGGGSYERWVPDPNNPGHYIKEIVVVAGDVLCLSYSGGTPQFPVRGGGGGGGGSPATEGESEYCRDLRRQAEATAGDLPFFGSPGMHGHNNINSLEGMLSTHQGYAAEAATLGRLLWLGGASVTVARNDVADGNSRLGRVGGIASVVSRVTGYPGLVLGGIANLNGDRQQTIIDALKAKIAYLKARAEGVCP